MSDDRSNQGTGVGGQEQQDQGPPQEGPGNDQRQRDEGGFDEGQDGEQSGLDEEDQGNMLNREQNERRQDDMPSGK
ncbi:hypothetical protein CA223_10950 [Sphingomonas koreensis]|jgi:hypothetical protein|uniref:Uncharacterized protein n=1 Tax=Sphingomonas koreensis TaxID=93064 RepID=A0A1L6JD51_9SPHN|nr:hypothetical protein [Sphingomonas koreensis]APR53856.1 hypothetical protein BRX40_16865 [Sphingomonas koreensis]MDC7808720.1 hypothetical protein [Sphingomonas koreensis]RSU17228.1 hypothetical protein CA224_22200 [Sphingomonas koreensis]RSU21123.1 hypothetical protein CA225_21335 [Sphingomonas koreensis]RSU23171.1 hypothetical protein CA222_16560 [Sphingomonas koreensis]